MKKKLLLFTMVFALLFQFSFFSVQASTPPTSSPEVCATPSREMILYQRFQEEMASKLLGGEFWERIFQADQQAAGLYTSKTLQLPPSENTAIDVIVASTWVSMRRLGNASLTTFLLLGLMSASVVSSNLEGIPMLFQDRAIVREWRTISKIETKIVQVAYFLGKTRNLLAPMKEISGLQEVVQKYVDDGLFTGTLVKQTGTSYYDVLRDLARMNASMKYFVAYNTISSLKDYKYPSLFHVEFNFSGLELMQEYYAPVRLTQWSSPCNASFKKMSSGVKQAFTANISSAKDAGEIIVSASKRLADAMAKTVGIPTKKQKDKTLAEQYFSEQELQQLRTIYGVDTTRMTNREAPRWKHLLQVGPSAKDSRVRSKKKMKTLIENTKNAPQAVRYVLSLKQVRDGVKRYNQSAGWSDMGVSQSDRGMIFSSRKTYYNQNFDDTLLDAYSASLADTLALYGETTENFVASDISTLAQNFLPLIDRVEQAEEVIGNKEKGIMKNIWITCQKQCANRGTKGCWPV